MRTLFARLAFVSIAVLLFLGAGLLGTATAKDKETPKKAEKTTALHLLEKDGGATFGDWVVWRYEEGGPAFFLINQKTGYAIYLPFSSNGWINYRTGGDEPDWYVLYSKGEPEKQNRDDLQVAKFIKMKRPAVSLEEGRCIQKDWTIKVTKDYIDFHCSTYDDRMTIRRSSGEVIHNGRSFGGKK